MSNSATNNSKTLRKLAVSGIFIAIYVVVIYFTQSFSYGPVQVRVVDSLYAVCYLYPFLAVPLSIASAIGNIFGGFGLPDFIGGFFAALVACYGMVLVKKHRLNEWLLALPTIVISGLMVPVWLAPLTHTSYLFLLMTISLGEIPSGILGVILVKQLKNRLPGL